MDLEWDSDDSNPSPASLAVWFANFDRKLKDEATQKREVAAKRATDELCRTCSRINLNPARLREKPYIGLYAYMGTFRDVLSRRKCPLCRLVVIAIIGTTDIGEVDCNTNELCGVDLSKEIELSWDAGLGFSVNVNDVVAQERYITFADDNGLLATDGDDESENGSEEDVEDEDDEVDEDGRLTSTKMPARPARLDSSRSIDKYTLDGWLYCCKKFHGQACEPTADNVAVRFSSTVLSGITYAFRLINVRSLTVVSMQNRENQDDYRYAALSYVWGGTSTLRLLRDNKEELMQRGSLGELWGFISATIRDAILLAKKLNFRYLWVDSLCLVQDDALDMLQGVSNMDTVYRGAEFTIIGAFGINANSGLPGVHAGTRDPKPVVETIKRGVYMTITESLNSVLNSSYYSTRAWTFQEQLLSQRTLVFAPNKGIYFQCCRAVWSLDTVFDEYPYIENFKPDPLYQAISSSDPDFMLHGPYNNLLLRYTDRNLTHSSDTLSAFKALENIMSARLGCKFLRGLPTENFDYYILFDGNGVTLERNDWFPSWSWAGWKGRVTNFALGGMMREVDALKEWVKERTWIVWYHREAGNPAKPVCDTANGDGGAISRSFQKHAQKHSLQLNTSQTEATDLFPRPEYPASKHLLQFWTLCIHLAISCIESPDGERTVRERGRLVDKEGTFCGSVRLDGYFFNPQATNIPVELILLSECQDVMPGSEIFESGEWLERKEWDLFWVMLIQTGEDGVVAERRGLGQIYQKAVSASLPPGPQWKEIFLA